MSLFAIGVGGSGASGSKLFLPSPACGLLQNGAISLRGSANLPGGTRISRSHPAGPCSDAMDRYDKMRSLAGGKQG